MKKHRIIYGIFFLLVLVIGIDGCKKINDQPADPYNINLRWNQAYATENRQKAETGLMWAFSFLGARLPEGSIKNAFTWDGHTVNIDLTRLGFSHQALQRIGQLIVLLKASEEYTVNGGIDIGRFIMLTLNSSHHYYAITGVDKTAGHFRERFVFDTVKAAVLESCVAKYHRTIRISRGRNISGTAFLAEEGSGNLAHGTFKPEEAEVIDIMPNGQLRFAIYNEYGELKMAADSAFTLAGKPGKCLWCHETSVSPPFLASTSIPGYYNPGQFRKIVAGRSAMLHAYRSILNTDIDFNALQDHTLTELLYISFMEPSSERLALEWNMTVETVKSRLSALPTHTHAEFPFLGSLYHRKDVDPLSPYSHLKVPESAREISAYEPDLIH